jgi:hypothetical protein
MVFSEWYKVPLWERTLRKIIFYMQREEQDRTSWMASTEAVGFCRPLGVWYNNDMIR